ncbi:peroxisome biosynthesis protein, peroxine-7 [Grosmannia clavigera kw1407]|uniref:Peroxin-7 n=1 Tax=Grosmannia clavigera (strain kw1407 / UAMH 11150) TaxID=655863 RepID=F0XHV2_GROCL|nr:peroxisome biosynthesis protein, peroxine-7 [Grosmannia clavigera kw1407]EFX02705.1 peroxisome biosynthesis protein, peroxine-7 [Grosmannia clavigera kw1407]
MAAPMLEFRTPGYNPYAVQYSPYYDSRVAVAASANFGIIGNGKLFVLELTAAGVQVGRTYDTNDAQFDVAWSEINENQLLVACGDGSLKLFDLSVDDFPVMSFHEHKREALSVSWNPATKDTFLTSSWDGTVKLWSPTRNNALRTLPIGTCTYSAAYCPSNPAIVSAASSDSLLRIFDLRTPVSAKYHLVASIPVHAGPGAGAGGGAAPAEILTHDWNKYNDTLIATGGVDKIIRTFDIRSPAAGPQALMLGHEFAVRRLAWSPHAHDVLLSASYDMTVRLWSDGSPPPPLPPPPPSGITPASQRLGRPLGVMNRHTEFTTGVDWCLFGEGGWVASAGWDERVLLWDANALIRGR